MAVIYYSKAAKNMTYGLEKLAPSPQFREGGSRSCEIWRIHPNLPKIHGTDLNIRSKDPRDWESRIRRAGYPD
ncbi:MAG TPA: hypothetical protein VFK27_05605 [Bacillales bacterium]|nr:hypothetical protein [Bacillales bacterium]